MNDIRLLVNQGLWVEEDIDEIRRKTITLNIPDIYERMNPTYNELLLNNMRKLLMKTKFNINLEKYSTPHCVLQLLQCCFFWQHLLL